MPFDRNELDVRTADGRSFLLLEGFSFTSKAGETITVPPGIRSDGASTPRDLWPRIPPFGTYWMAAFLHDYLYRWTLRPKAECDNLFREAMEDLDVNSFERDVIYQGVHLFGWKPFAEDRQ